MKRPKYISENKFALTTVAPAQKQSKEHINRILSALFPPLNMPICASLLTIGVDENLGEQQKW